MRTLHITLTEKDVYMSISEDKHRTEIHHRDGLVEVNGQQTTDIMLTILLAQAIEALYPAMDVVEYASQLVVKGN